MSETIPAPSRTDNKENMENDAAQPKSRKLRSKSLGVGELQRQQALAAPKNSRRASMMIGGDFKEPPRGILQPAIPISPLQQITQAHSGRTSIVPVKAPAIMMPLKTEEEQQKAREQREAERTVALTHREKRRKSLGNRRVSFNPEVTMHMIDLINQRTPSDGERTAAATPAAKAAAATTPTPTPAVVIEEEDRPSTPPEQVETETPLPESARAEHKAENRKLPTMTPPMNFNNPNDFSSSPTPSSAFSSPGVTDEAESVLAPDNSSDEDDDDAMSMVSPSVTVRTNASEDSDDGSDMDIADDNEITGAFKPWIVKQAHEHPRLNHPEADFKAAPTRPQDSNPNMPWSGPTHDHPRLSHPEHDFNSAPNRPAIMRQDTEADEDDMAMDITRVVGKGVLASPTPIQTSGGSDAGGMTMDFTQAIGGVFPSGNTQSTKSSWGNLSPVRVSDIFGKTSSDDDEMEMDITRVVGRGLLNAVPQRLASHSNENNPFSPAFSQRQNSGDDQTMDITRVIGGIQDWSQEVDPEDEEMTMEFTRAVGGLLGNRRQQEDEDTAQSMSMDSDMDMTVALGGILQQGPAPVGNIQREDRSLYSMPSPAAPALALPSFDAVMDGASSASTGPRTPSESVLPDALREEDRPVVDVKISESGSPKLTRSTRRTPVPKSPKYQRAGPTPFVQSTPTKSTTPKAGTPSKGGFKTPQVITPVKSAQKATSTRQTPQSSTRAQAALTPTSKAAEADKVNESLPGFGHGLSAKRRVAGIASATATPQKTKAEINAKSPTPRRASGVGISKVGLGSPAIKAVLNRRKSLTDDASSLESFSPGAKGFQDIMKDIKEDRKQTKTFEEAEREQAALPGTADLRVMIRMMTPRKEPVRTSSPKQQTVSKRLFGDIIENNVNSPDLGAQAKDSLSPVKKKRKSLEDDVFAKNTPAASFTHSPARTTRATRKNPDKPTVEKPSIRFADESRENTLSVPTVIEGLNDESLQEDDEISEVLPNISMKEFLSMTSISFLDDLNTKHRRETGAWTAGGHGLGRSLQEDEEVSLSDRSIAAFVTTPNLELFTHSCRELKKFISEGKRMAKQIEKKAQEENPPLFREYRLSPPDVKTVMDTQFQDIKSFSRLRARQTWYEWRKQLMETLAQGAGGNLEPMQLDDELLNKRKELIAKSLPQLSEKHDALDERVQVLRARKAEIDSCDPVELKSTRIQLEATLKTTEEKKTEMLKAEQALFDLDEKLRLREERKATLKGEIEDAEKVKEANKGFSTEEVRALKGNVERLEKKYSWSIVSICPNNNLVMTYKSHLVVSFYLNSLSNSVTLRSTLTDQSIQYTHLLATLSSSLKATNFATPRQLLSYIQKSWDARLATLEDIRKLELQYPLSVLRKSDEDNSLTIRAMLLVRSRKAKIKIDFVVSEDMSIVVKSETVYGDQMKGWKIDEFLMQVVSEGAGWRDAVGELVKNLAEVGGRK